MHARVAQFRFDTNQIEANVTQMREDVESGVAPPGLEGTKMMMLVNRETGDGMGIVLFESEEAMRRGDAALNEMSPGGGSERTSVEMFEVAVASL